MRRAVIACLSLALVATACGLKVPVTLVEGNTYVGDPNNPDLAADLPGVPGVDPVTGEPVTSDDPNLTDPGNGKEIIGPTGTPTGLFKRETEGITKDQITICGHVPITGASPVAHHPDRWGQFYFNYVNKEQGGVYGRKVRFIAYDDQYYPAGARAAAEKCRRDGAFLYYGAAGTDQIVSVARWAEQMQIPYFHGPTSDKDMKGFKYNVHLAPTYEQQHRWLARYLVKKFGTNVDYGMVRVNSPYFGAGHDAYVDELKKLGVTLVVDRQVQKDESQFQDIYIDLENKGKKGENAGHVEVVNAFTTPLLWLKMLGQKKSSYNPTWTAVSPIAGYQIVSKVLGTQAKAIVMHHFNPACDCVDYKSGYPDSLPWSDDIAEFLKIFRKYSPEQDPPVDDFDYGAYQAAKGLHDLLLKVGKDPTRSGLFNLLKTYKEDPKAVFPRCAADYTRGGTRQGGWRVNLYTFAAGKWKQAPADTCIDIT